MFVYSHYSEAYQGFGLELGVTCFGLGVGGFR